MSDSPSTLTNASWPDSPALLYERDATGRLLRVGGACERFLGCAPANAIGRNLEDWFRASAASLAHWEDLVTNSSRGESDLPVELELIAENAMPLWVEIRETPGQSDDTWSGVIIDITMRRLRETQIVEAQRLENLGLLAAGIAHDLNNILSPILIAGSLLEPLAQEESHRRLIQVLQGSAERGARIVRQILQFAQAHDESRGPVEIRLILRELMLVVEETFPRTINLVCNCPPGLPAVQADPSQLHQLLLNLAINARDAMPEGGNLTFSVETFLLQEPPPHTPVAVNRAQWLRITIADTGIGMTPAQLEQMWTPFFTTKPSDRGTGLGLSTVRSLITAHGGFIEVESQPGAGTRFHVNLPTLPQAKPPAESPSPPPTSAPPGTRVLVVDDEASVRDVIRETLGSRGYEVLLAADGVEALSIINFNPRHISLVITDIHMPHMTGDILVNVLRRIAPDLPVLAISGHPNAHERWQGPRQAQPTSSLAKPFSGKVLLSTVNALVQKRHAKTPPEAPPPA